MFHRIKGLEPHEHATVSEARACQAEYEQAQAEMAGELAAEAGYERWLEDAGSRIDPAGYERDREAEANDLDLQLMRETREIQARERADDERAYAAKAARDDELNACRGGVCIDTLRLCSRHSAQYQARYGRAANE